LFFKLTIGFYVCLNKTGFIEHSELNMVILIYQLLIFDFLPPETNYLERFYELPPLIVDVTG